MTLSVWDNAEARMFWEATSPRRPGTAPGGMDYDYQTAHDAKWVSGQIELSYRNDKLRWTHDRVVASLDPRRRC